MKIKQTRRSTAGKKFCYASARSASSILSAVTFRQLKKKFVIEM